jgi:predicted RNA binding protein YcfA (HicA-like mRNA interferase family)
MPKSPVLTGKEMLKFLEWLGFTIVRTKGSHYRLRHADGRITTVAVHGNTPLPVGTMHKIIYHDLGLDNERFGQMLNDFHKR